MMLSQLCFNTLRADAEIEEKRQNAIEQVKMLYYLHVNRSLSVKMFYFN